MIPKDHEFDFIVCEGIALEVWRGQSVAIAQQFGVDWDGPVSTVTYGGVFTPVVPVAEDARAHIATPVLSARVRRVRVRRLLSRRVRRDLLWFVLGLLAASLLAWAVFHGG
jgi:hypothetical protein